MRDYSVTLRLSGDISVAEFAEKADLWAKVLGSLADELGQQVRWVISDLEYSSAIMTAAPIAETEEAAAYLHRLPDDYLSVARDIRAGRIDQRRPTLRLVKQLVERAAPGTDITFETPEDEVTFQGAFEAMALSERDAEMPSVLGTLRGRIETLSQRRGLRFTLYDLLTDRAVSCYIEPGQEELLRNVWGRLADVTGRIKRDARTDRPVSLRKVSSINVIADPDAGGFVAARGAVMPAAESPPSEVVIRQLRDAG
ncbi:MAG: hypothetical protein ACR2L3_03460 [Actinomycetota bacterium]